MVYVTGDMHGDMERFSGKAMRKLKKGDTLIVCGDFGFVWNGTRQEQRNLRKLARKKYTVAFLDGAHENFEALAAYPEAEWNGGTVRRLADNILYLTRGSLYTIEDERYFVMGGGERDKDRAEAAEENRESALPGAQELQQGLRRLSQAGNRVDYILTHEPSGKAGAYVIPNRRRSGGLDIYFDGIEQTVAYRCWYFGSIHADKRITARHIAVYKEVLPVK